MIPAYEPWLSDLEKKYVNEALDSGWISSTGKFVDLFEEKFAAYIGTKYAISTTSGTTACHIALEACGLSADDEIIVPDSTFIATANACRYANLHIGLCDIDKNNWNIDTPALEDMIGPFTKAIFAVHLYGVMNNMDILQKLCDKYNLMLIEDACEALGGTWREKKAGSFGKAACFSFYGNKTLTTGEGGMVVTDDYEVYKQARLLRGQGQTERYFHPVIGYNYRMSNVLAALGVAQLERVEEIMAEKKRVFGRYQQNLASEINKTIYEQDVSPFCKHAMWVYVIRAIQQNEMRERIQFALSQNQIETRRCFYPVSSMPPYKSCRRSSDLYNSYFLSRNGLVLPSHPTLKNEEIDQICEVILKNCN